MDSSHITVAQTDYYSRVFYAAATMDDYYACVEALRPILRSSEWDDVVTGYYAFRFCQVPHKGPLPHPSLRLIYFTRTREDHAQALEITRDVPLKRVHEDGPFRDRLHTGDMKHELPFRWFLCAATQVGFDLMEDDFEPAKQLYEYLQKSKEWGDARGDFISELEGHGEFYQSLEQNKKINLVDGTEFTAIEA